MTEVTIRTARSLGEETVGADGEPYLRLTALGLVVSEHVDKIGFFEPSVEVAGKTVLPDGVRIVLRRKGALGKPIGEIVRGFKIGCFKIAREYGLVKPGDAPIFLPGFAAALAPASADGV